MIAKTAYKYHCIEQFEKRYENFQRREYEICNEISESHVKLNKEILQNKVWDTDEENNIAYITGVLFMGLKEFIQITELISDTEWHFDNQQTERIWNLMWNCIERFKFCSVYFQTEVFTWIQTVLQSLYDYFIDLFGLGIYSSPEIFISKEICSICQQDTRACIHINGRLYSGKMCSSIPQDIKLHSVAFVTVPRDPRCRIWSWNMKEDSTITTAILTLFRIDDWLIDEK